MKRYSIAWCPMCNQGWVNIVKDRITKELFLCCQECESEWDTPKEINESNVLPFNTHLQYETPKEEDIVNKNWLKYVIDIE